MPYKQQFTEKIYAELLIISANALVWNAK